MPATRSFSSDNHAGAHPEVLAAIERANAGPAMAYGEDPWTARAVEVLQRHFGEDAGVYFVFGGTAANVLSLQTTVRSHHAIVCADSAHIAADEGGAPERWTGCKLLPLPTPDGRLTADQILKVATAPRSQHWPIPRVVSVSQQSECGTVYDLDALRAIAEVAHGHGMYLHMDGARLVNAVASLGCSLREASRDVGVDVLSLGGAKNGMLFGEAVVFFRPELASEFANVRKQGMQLASKMRFIAVQFEALFGGDLWRRNAEHANGLARRLRDRVVDTPGVRLKWPVDGNTLFAALDPAAVARLHERYMFEVWNEAESLVRWMTSWATTEADLDAFADAVRAAAASGT